MTKSPDIPNRRKVSMTFSSLGIPLPPSVWQAGLQARDLKGETGNVIAVIGDGSLSGGEASKD